MGWRSPVGTFLLLHQSQGAPGMPPNPTVMVCGPSPSRRPPHCSPCLLYPEVTSGPTKTDPETPSRRTSLPPSSPSPRVPGALLTTSPLPIPSLRGLSWGPEGAAGHLHPLLHPTARFWGDPPGSGCWGPTGASCAPPGGDLGCDPVLAGLRSGPWCLQATPLPVGPSPAPQRAQLCHPVLVGLDGVGGLGASARRTWCSGGGSSSSPRARTRSRSQLGRSLVVPSPTPCQDPSYPDTPWVVSLPGIPPSLAEFVNSPGALPTPLCGGERGWRRALLGSPRRRDEDALGRPGAGRAGSEEGWWLLGTGGDTGWPGGCVGAG